MHLPVTTKVLAVVPADAPVSVTMKMETVMAMVTTQWMVWSIKTSKAVTIDQVTVESSMLRVVASVSLSAENVSIQIPRLTTRRDLSTDSIQVPILRPLDAYCENKWAACVHHNR